MKKLLLIFLALIMCVAPLAACGEPDETTAPEETTTYDYDKIPEVIEPHEQKVVTSEELGYAAQVAKTSKYWVADAEVKAGDITITSYNPGVAVITVMNNYSEKVEVTVTVGLDYSIESVEFEKFVKPENSVNAKDYGLSVGNADNAKALQAAIDALPNGGTVYIPKGIYKTTFVELKSNITLRLEGVLEEYNRPLDSQTAAKIGGSRIAVITAINGDIFANHKAKGWGREGADNIAIIGGAIDMQGKSRAFIWCCGDGILLENVIMKDCRNDHAIQITGCKNVTIRNCMFVGYNLGTGVTGGETIQIETTSTGAIGDGTVTASKFDDYEYISSENIVIENVYFGKSDRFESHTYPIGHHGHPAKDVAVGLKVLNCTFDNPRIVAMRMFAYSDVEIANCEFISDRDNTAVPGENRYMIELTFNTGTCYVKTGGFYLATEAQRGACRNLDIHDNVFTIGEKSKIIGIFNTLKEGNIDCDAIAYSGVKIADHYKDQPTVFRGYQFMTNRIENVKIYNNEFNIDMPLCRTPFKLSSVRGLTFENNTLNSSVKLVSGKLDGETVDGALFSSCTSASDYADKFTVSAISSNTFKPIVMTGGDADIESFCTASDRNNYYKITFEASEGGSVGRSIDDGALYIEPVADEGYVFDGYYSNGAKIEGDKFDFNKNVKVEVKFVAE